MLLSRGLIDAISRDDWRACAQRLVCGSGDWRLHACLQALSPAMIVFVADNRRFAKRTNLQGWDFANNVLWSTLHGRQHVREAVLRVLAN